MSWRLATLLAGALALRLAIAPAPSYWVDEAFTVRLLDGDLGGLADRVAQTESTPPLYYAFAWAWTQVMGLGELGLRSISAVAGAATVGLAWALGRWVAGPRAALAAGALVAVNPFLVWFSTEARAYALATAATTAALLLLVRMLARDAATDGARATATAPRAPAGDETATAASGNATDGDGRRLAAWAALAAAALATHYAAAFVVGAQAAILLRRRGGRAAWAAVAAVAAVGAALIPLAAAQRGNEHSQTLDELSGPLGERVAQLPKQFAIGYDAPLEIVAGALALAVLAGGVALALLGGRERRARALVPLTVAAAGVVAPLAAAAGGLDVVASRYLLPALVPLLVVAGAGLAGGRPRPRPAPQAAGRRRLEPAPQAGRRWGSGGTLGPVGPALAVALTAGWLAVTVVVAADPRLQTRPDWQGVESALGPAPAGGRAIVASPSNGALVLVDAYRLRATYGPPLPVDEVILATTADAAEALPGLPAAPPQFAAAGFELAEQRRERGYALQRWRSHTPRPLDPALLAQAALDPSTPSAILWQPPSVP